MPQAKRPAECRDGEPAALAALTISESLILTLIESGTLDPQTLRRCLLDAVAACEGTGSSRRTAKTESRAGMLIDNLLRQVEASAPSSAARADKPIRPSRRP